MRDSELDYMSKEEVFEHLEKRCIGYTYDDELLLRTIEIIKEQDKKIQELQLALGINK